MSTGSSATSRTDHDRAIPAGPLTRHGFITASPAYPDESAGGAIDLDHCPAPTRRGAGVNRMAYQIAFIPLIGRTASQAPDSAPESDPVLENVG